MKKTLIIINGTMGVGKTTTCKELNNNLEKSVWLDGDWCWMMNPFIVNDENKNMVIKNITYLLRSFLMNSSIDYVIFNWVIHMEEIFNQLLDPLKDLDFKTKKITLICSEETLKNRIAGDKDRDQSTLNISIERLDLYTKMSTIKIDTTHLSVIDTVDKIKSIINES